MLMKNNVREVLEGVFMAWYCVFTPLKIRVNDGPKFVGYYDLLEEPYCKKCSSPGVKTEDCILQDWVYGFNRVYALGKYISYERSKDNLLSSHIRFLKYSGQKQCSIPLGSALSLFVKNKYPELLNADYIVPVPAHKSKISKRGYNQTELLTAEYCKNTSQISLLCLEQLKNIEFASMKLGLAKRYEQVKGMFKLQPSFYDVISGKYILLLDDVVTSCSQSSECSRLLINHGADKVDVLALGRNVLDDTI